MLYHYIAGEPLTRVTDESQAHTLGRSLAAMLEALHSTALDEARAADVLDLSGSGWGEVYGETCDRFRTRVAPLLPASEIATARSFLDRLVERVSDPTISATLVHRDLGPAHLLCCEGVLAGVIDWTDACIGDPAIDLAWTLHGSPPLLASALEAVLEVGAEVRERSLLYHQLGPWYEVEFGLNEGRDELVSSGLHGVLDRLSLHPHR